MLCQNCSKRVASVHFTKIVNNKKVELYLCEECAREKGKLDMGTSFNFGMPFSIDDFFSGIVGSNVNGQYMTHMPEIKRCNVCGMTYEDFSKTGKMGCSECYNVFKDEIAPLVKRIHGVVEHQGKVPEAVSGKLRIANEIRMLKEQLQKSILNEEYEKAARLRDKIRQLESMGQGG